MSLPSLIHTLLHLLTNLPSSPWILLLPLKTLPYTDGWSWARKEGLEGHMGLEDGDEITDEEEV